MKVQENDIKKEMKGENNGNATNYQVRWSYEEKERETKKLLVKTKREEKKI